MINFAVDISDTVSEFSLQKEETDSLSSYLLDRVVEEYMAKWQDLINSDLHGSIEEYKRAIYTDRPDDHTAIIGMTARSSRLAMMIETGADAFDEKIGFEASSKKHIKKGGGWYLTIPFRHGVSEAIMGMDMADSDVTVLDFMKSGGVTTQQNLPEPFNQIETNQLTLSTGSIITYKHKAPIYEGMHRRDISSTEAEKRGGYMTFRRVSDKSDEESWFHPGIAAHNFMDKALVTAQLDRVVDNAVQDWLDVKFG